MPINKNILKAPQENETFKTASGFLDASDIVTDLGLNSYINVLGLGLNVYANNPQEYY